MERKYYFYCILLGIIISFIVAFTYEYHIKEEIIGEITEENNKEVMVDIKPRPIEFNYENSFLLAEGKKAYYEGDLKQAASYYLKFIEENPPHKEALKNLITIKLELARYEESFKYFQKLITLETDDIHTRYQYGITLYKTANYQQAKTQLLKVFNSLSPNCLSARKESLLYYYLGQVFREEGLIAEAKEYYKKGIDYYPFLILNYLALAEVYYQENNLAKTNTAYSLALNKDSSLTYLLPKLARNYEVLEDYSQALYYWQRSLATEQETKLARERINYLAREHSYLFQTSREARQEERSKINWAKASPIVVTEEIPLIRIGLIDRAQSLTLQAGTSFSIIDKEGNKHILSAEGKKEAEIVYKDGEFIFYQEQLMETIKTKSPLILKLHEVSTFVLYDISYGQGYFWAGSEDRQYRGDIKLYPVDKDNFNLINLINLEDYLLSVVPAEMPNWWPSEALKAQAVAARSYALFHLNRFAHRGYDLCSTVRSMVYRGANSETSPTTQAVLETQGKIAYYNNQIVEGVFSSNSGGLTESSKDVWGSDLPYLTGVNNLIDSDIQLPLQPYQLKEWLIEEPPSYANKTTFTNTINYRWIKVLTSNFIQEQFSLDSFDNITALKRSQAGSVEKILIEGGGKEIVIEKDRIRSRLGGLRSNRFVMSKKYNSQKEITEIIFYGSGFGHGVGLDQSAAAGMAASTYNYQEIIKHFYQGSEIKKTY